MNTLLLLELINIVLSTVYFIIIYNFPPTALTTFLISYSKRYTLF